MAELLKSFTGNNWVLLLFMLLPGLISMRVYRLLMPCQKMKWENELFNALFYSIINFAVGISISMFWTRINFLLPLVILVFFPVLYPIIFVLMHKMSWTKKLMTKVQQPYPTSWDYFFNRKQQCFMIITLKTGNKLAGFWGEGSYASNHRSYSDIYLSATYSLASDGDFNDVIPYTKGLWVSMEDCLYIEFFEVPPQETKK